MTRGDFDTPENRIGAMNLARDWESCMILSPTPENQGWSYRSNGITRSLDECIRMLASTVSGGGNLLLNLAPDQYGAFRPMEIEIARGMGAWLRKYGEAIYATRGGPFMNGKWGGSTHRDHTVYLHVFEWHAERLVLGPLSQNIVSACLLPDREPITFEQTGEGTAVFRPSGQGNEPVTVIELTLDRPVARGEQTAGAP
jgi:alpha-L-fucosidase